MIFLVSSFLGWGRGKWGSCKGSGVRVLLVPVPPPSWAPCASALGVELSQDSFSYPRGKKGFSPHTLLPSGLRAHSVCCPSPEA